MAPKWVQKTDPGLKKFPHVEPKATRNAQILAAAVMLSWSVMTITIWAVLANSGSLFYIQWFWDIILLYIFSIKDSFHSIFRLNSLYQCKRFGWTGFNSLFLARNRVSIISEITFLKITKVHFSRNGVEPDNSFLKAFKNHLNDCL